MIVVLCGILGGILGAFIFSQDNYWFVLYDNPNWYPGSSEPSSINGPIEPEGILYIVIGIACGAMIGFLVHSIINSIKKGNHNSTVQVNEDKLTNVEKLKSYKELLDVGAITQEEFDKKKKELL